MSDRNKKGPDFESGESNSSTADSSPSFKIDSDVSDVVMSGLKSTGASIDDALEGFEYTWNCNSQSEASEMTLDEDEQLYLERLRRAHLKMCQAPSMSLSLLSRHGLLASDALHNSVISRKRAKLSKTETEDMSAAKVDRSLECSFNLATSLVRYGKLRKAFETLILVLAQDRRYFYSVKFVPEFDAFRKNFSSLFFSGDMDDVDRCNAILIAAGTNGDDKLTQKVQEIILKDYPESAPILL